MEYIHTVQYYETDKNGYNAPFQLHKVDAWQLVNKRLRKEQL